MAMASSTNISRPASRMSWYASHHASSCAANPMPIHQEPTSIPNSLKAAPVKLPTRAANPVAKPR